MVSMTSFASWTEWAKGDMDEVGTPQRPIVGAVAEKATDADAEGYGTLLVHGGCLADGARARDLWAFDVRSRVWKQLPDAPGQPCDGAALALSRGRLYRFGGFNGAMAEGGQLDYLKLGVESFNDTTGAGEVALCAGRHGWQSFVQGKEDVGYKEVDAVETPLALANQGREDEAWPGHRHAASLEAITVGGGREYLVLALGEHEASGAGPEAARKFWDDVWASQVPSDRGPAASITDTVLSTVGRQSGEGKWVKVEMRPRDEDDSSVDGPGPRGWIAASRMGEIEGNALLVWGGLVARKSDAGRWMDLAIGMSPVT